MSADKSPALSQAEAALAGGHYDQATAAAMVSLATSAERLAQTSADLVDAFARYLVLNGHDGPPAFNGSGRSRDQRPTDREP